VNQIDRIIADLTKLQERSQRLEAVIAVLARRAGGEIRIPLVELGAAAGAELLEAQSKRTGEFVILARVA
jgi:hypothetical protein